MTSLLRHGVGGILGLLAVVVMGASSARGSSVLDQSNLVGSGFDAAWLPNFGTGGGAPGMFAQTFTVGVTGYLSEVDLRISRYGLAGQYDAGTLTVDVRSTVGGVPGVSNGAALASVSELLSQLPATPQTGEPGFTAFVFAGGGPLVHAGDVLAITTANDLSSASYVMWGGPNAYGGGNGYLKRVVDTSWGSEGIDDFSFETFVTPVPLPSAVGEGAVGLVCVMGVMWCGRRMRRA
ncbi:MAG TPA: hypothetical protein VM008_12420 [Phycisphaerae bacterium]|nr:hypothetical protein [Phycisphaerae bacterium]